jgi:hypothetical protein
VKNFRRRVWTVINDDIFVHQLQISAARGLCKTELKLQILLSKIFVLAVQLKSFNKKKLVRIVQVL